MIEASRIDPLDEPVHKTGHIMDFWVLDLWDTVDLNDSSTLGTWESNFSTDLATHTLEIAGQFMRSREVRLDDDLMENDLDSLGAFQVAGQSSETSSVQILLSDILVERTLPKPLLQHYKGND